LNQDTDRASNAATDYSGIQGAVLVILEPNIDPAKAWVDPLYDRPRGAGDPGY
jgi:hypothetical protein